jgi:hypothetical protein
METELILSIGGFPPFSARGCEQILKPIQQKIFKRTINGDLVAIGSGILKYESTISCQDKTTLATEGLCPGMKVDVGCIQRLWQKVEASLVEKDVLLERKPVENSIAVVNERGDNMMFHMVSERTIRLAASDKPCFITYRPWLCMKLVTFQLTTNEWGMTAGWSLKLEEA